MSDVFERMVTIRSGGQTGVDRAALDAALSLGFSVTGWCPKGRLAEDGCIPSWYPLTETESPEYAERTRRNVIESQATLILSPGPLRGGTCYTAEVARSVGRPWVVVDPRSASPRAVASWITGHGIADLNVAGPRESEEDGIYHIAEGFMEALLRALMAGAR